MVFMFLKKSKKIQFLTLLVHIFLIIDIIKYLLISPDSCIIQLQFDVLHALIG